MIRKIARWIPLVALAAFAIYVCLPNSKWITPAQAQERTNTFYASQFQGADKYTKIANAQAQCNPNLPCYVVVDAILSNWPTGTLISPNVGVLFVDYTSGGTIVYSGSAGGVNLSTNGINPTPTGVGALGTTAFRWSQLNMGDASGGVRWIASGVYTATRTLTVPDGPSGTNIVASLVTTAAASDNVAMQGMTASGHCSLTATNASAATNIATTFISAKASNQITVAHTATASMNYDVMCTSF